MKILEVNEYTRMDYAAARRNNDSVTVRPLNIDVEQIVKDFRGPPSYIFWDTNPNGKEVVGYSIPYTSLTQRRDNTILVFGLTSGCRMYSLTPPGLSKVWKVVEDMSGTFASFTGLKLRELVADVEAFNPEILQAPSYLLKRLMAAEVSLDQLARIVVVSGGCYAPDVEVMAAAHERWQVPVVTFLSFPWLGPVTATDGQTFKADFVGEEVGKFEIKFDKEGYFCLRSVMTQEAQMFVDGQWQTLDWRFYRSAVKGLRDKDGYYVTERPDVATPPQPMDH